MQNSLLKEIYNLQQQKDLLVQNQERIKAQIDALDTLIETKRDELLNILKDADISEFSNEGIVCIKQEKHNVGYRDESQVIDFLKNTYNGQYLRVKVTEALDKKELKKAIKADEALKMALDSMIEDSVTEYLVITTEENRARMLDHMKSE